MSSDATTDDTVAGHQRESPLQWLNRRKDKTGRPMIGREQLAAGLRLASDFEAAERGPRTTMSWDGLPRGPGGTCGDDASRGRDRAMAARMRLERALVAVGPDFAGVLIDVCCRETGLEQIERRAGWPNRSAKLVVQLALNALARHYGFLPSAGPRDAGWSATQPQTGSTRHWGAPDYRPRIGGG